MGAGAYTDRVLIKVKTVQYVYKWFNTGLNGGFLRYNSNFALSAMP
jgi:hypothetical protein